MNLTIDLPEKHPVGTVFTMRGKGKRIATVIGHHIEHNTDTAETKVTYRITYDFCGQQMFDDVVRTTIDMALAQ